MADFDFSLDDLLEGFEGANIDAGDIREVGGGGGFDIFEAPEINLPENLPEFDYNGEELEFNEDFTELEEDIENIDPAELEDTEVVVSPDK